MAGTLKVKSLQLGDSATATQNFVLSENSDGTVKLARGNVGATTQDILTIDAAGVASLLGKQVFSRGNVLGAVSQAGGVPTGAVIEVIANANGTATRWADGTQICTMPFPDLIACAANAHTSHATRAYPAAFAATPAVAFSCTPLMAYDFYGCMSTNAGLVSCQPTVKNGATVQNTVLNAAIAIGRWF